MSSLNNYNFNLPEKYIAQSPLEQRDESKLLILKGNKILHKKFKDIRYELNKDDILVLNNSKVMTARFSGRKESGGKVNLLFIREIEPNIWQCLIEGRRIRPNVRIMEDEGYFEMNILKRIREGIFLTQVFSKES
ncbi:MAG: S-adenosylmethionine:tRNA ribosyltransferase-isomerase, partial [Candidatus Helarchaeota archaeon]